MRLRFEQQCMLASIIPVKHPLHQRPNRLAIAPHRRLRYALHAARQQERTKHQPLRPGVVQPRQALPVAVAMEYPERRRRWRAGTAHDAAPWLGAPTAVSIRRGPNATTVPRPPRTRRTLHAVHHLRRTRSAPRPAFGRAGSPVHGCGDTRRHGEPRRMAPEHPYRSPKVACLSGP
jgi:hypothetical protein